MDVGRSSASDLVADVAAAESRWRTGASIAGSGSVLLAALIGFILGFALKVRRASN
jgi:hypothetical protein